MEFLTNVVHANVQLLLCRFEYIRTPRAPPVKWSGPEVAFSQGDAQDVQKGQSVLCQLADAGLIKVCRGRAQSLENPSEDNKMKGCSSSS